MENTDRRSNHREEGVSIDEALQTSIGELGRGQWRIALLVDYVWLTTAMQVFLMSLAEVDPVAENLWSCVDSNDDQCSHVLGLNDVAKRSDEFCKLDASQWQWDRKNGSTVSDFNLQCNHVKVQMVKSFFFVGWLLGAGILGYISDKLGRHGALFFSMGISAISTFLGALAPNYWCYLISRIFSGVGNGGQSTVGFVLVSEIIGPSYRGKHAFLCQIYFVLGECLIVGAAFFIRHWRYLTLSVDFFIAIFFLTWWWIPESPRWLLVNGRQDEALRVLKGVARANRTEMPPASILDVSHANKTNEVMVEVLGHPQLRKWLAIVLTTWLVVCNVYYGVTLVTDQMEGSMYLKFLLVSLAELPSYIIFAMVIDILGRRTLYVGGFLIGGLSCLSVLVVPKFLELPMALLGKFGASGAFALSFLYTTEIFPTSVRNFSLGCCNMSSRIGGILAPQISLLAKQFFSSLPFIVFGVAGVFAAVISMGLPETLGKPLPDTIQDVDNLIASKGPQKSWKFWRRSQPYVQVDTRER